jgi:protein TonB
MARRRPADRAVAAPNLDGRERSARWGYTGAIILSALGHAIFFALVLVVLPGYFRQPKGPPPSYTVKIVDQLPAGDLGTHLPRLSQERRRIARREEHKKPAVERPKPPPAPAPDNDKNVIALNTRVTPTPTPIAERTPEPTPEPTLRPTPEPTRAPTPRPTAKRRARRRRPTPTPTPKRSERRREPERKIVMAHAEPTPNVKEQLAALKQQLLKEDLEHRKLTAAEQAKANGPSGGGPVVANVPSEGAGYGVGSGTGSAGIQQDLQFLLYYRTVQERIKKAWNFAGGSGDLTTSVTFAIGPDGKLTGVKVTQSSQDPAFDDSVIRAIRRAAPFPPPPEKYRPQFAQGVEAVFKLGELKS